MAADGNAMPTPGELHEAAEWQAQQPPRVTQEFTFDDDDIDGLLAGDEVDDETDPRRLSFMFEHNSLINMRITSLANELRSGTLPPPDEEHPEVSSGGPLRKLRGQASSSSGFRTRVLSWNIPEDEPDTAAGDLRLPRSSAPANLEKVGAGRHRRRSSDGSDAGASTTSDVIPSCAGRVGARGSRGDAEAKLAAEIDLKAARQEIAELRGELLNERLRADKEKSALQRDLRKCQHVIERLVKELDLATRTPATAPLRSIGSREGSNASVLGRPAGSVSRTPSAASDGPSLQAPSNSSIIADLNSAVGSFFGQLGLGFSSNERAAGTLATPSRMLSPNRDTHEEAEDEFDDEPFCWATVPLSTNVKVSENGQTAMFTGVDKSDLRAFVVTEEPPLLEADQGYGFEVRIERVRAGHEDGLAIGFTALPPDAWPEELPETADLLDTTWLVGYNGEIYNGGDIWDKCPWCPANLVVGDRVGVQVSLEGKLHVVVNQRIVFTYNISTPSPLTSALYGIVDLLGNTDAITLLD